MRIKYERTTRKLPAVQHRRQDAGYDLYYVGEDITIQPISNLDPNNITDDTKLERLLTNFKVAMPDGVFGYVTGRSGLSSEGLMVVQGTIDPGYRGTISVQCCSLLKPIKLKHGDRIAQIIFMNYIEPDFIEGTVEEDTPRGTGSFGSTGGYL